MPLQQFVEAMHGVSASRAATSANQTLEKFGKFIANRIIRDQAAVLEAITSPWSSGQVEGQITKPKLVKR